MTLLAPKSVAARLGLSTSRVIQLDREGALPAMRDSVNRRLYDAAAVEAFAQERERRAAAVIDQHASAGAA
jgi:DNA-binding transcriptional MerR regulator